MAKQSNPHRSNKAPSQSGPEQTAPAPTPETGPAPSPEAADEHFIDDVFSDLAALQSGGRRETPGKLDDAALIRSVNAKLKKMGLKPDVTDLAGFDTYPSLHGRRIIMIDDSGEVLRAFAPALEVATNGNAYFIKHTDQKVPDLARAILKIKPDVVLMDGSLNNGLRGWNVISRLMESDDRLVCLGFSGDETYERNFTNNGAQGFVDKDPDRVALTMRGLADQVSITLDLR